MIKSPRSGTMLNVSSVKQASDLLKHCWTKHCGPLYDVAMSVCAKALDGEATAREARFAFVEAAKEVEAFVEEKTQASAAHRSAKDKVNVAAFSIEEGAPQTPHPDRAS
ncbi:MAG: DUF982 domain-containing protein [Phyllobacterium sp.]|uniref:DUF982 domain-containing protein n=1 Tax=Phyllobacterium sp. TaxID=1871046 RepID=UPI0030F1AFF2